MVDNLNQKGTTYLIFTIIKSLSEIIETIVNYDLG